MARGSARVLDDDEEYDLVDFMLDACGIDSSDFHDNERVLTRENLEKNFEFLEKMVVNRSFRRTPYFVLGYFILITGTEISDQIRLDIIEAAEFKHEEGLWLEKGFEIERRIYLKDFRQKIQAHKAGQMRHPIQLIYLNGKNDIYTKYRSQVIIGIKEFQESCQSGRIYNVQHLLLQGEGLETIPKVVFNMEKLESLCLDYNKLKEIPQGMTNLANLKILSLDYNQFTTFPESVIELPYLKTLSLNNNYIGTLPVTITNFKALEALYIYMNNINELPKIFRNVNFWIKHGKF